MNAPGEACNLDARGVKQRLGGAVVALAAGLVASAWMIESGKPLWLRIVVALVAFGFASLSLLQARAKT